MSWAGWKRDLRPRAVWQQRQRSCRVATLAAGTPCTAKGSRYKASLHLWAAMVPFGNGNKVSRSEVPAVQRVLRTACESHTELGEAVREEQGRPPQAGAPLTGRE